MRVIKHFFVPCFRRRPGIKEESCGMDHLDFFPDFKRFLQKKMINRRGERLILTDRFILIRRIPDDKIKFHKLTFLLWSAVIQCACALSPLLGSGNTARMCICRVEVEKNLKSGRRANAKRQLPANALSRCIADQQSGKGHSVPVLPHSIHTSLLECGDTVRLRTFTAFTYDDTGRQAFRRDGTRGPFKGRHF